MSRSTLVTLLVIVAIIALAGVYTFTLKADRKVKSSEAYSALSTTEEVSSYTDLGGDEVELTDYTGKVLVVNSWASWCPFCVDELPDFAQLGREYADQGVVVLAINRRESKEMAERFLRTVGATEGVTLILDPDDNFYKSVGGISMPETLFYDRNGNIVVHKRGPMEIEEMREHTSAALSVAKE